MKEPKNFRKIETHSYEATNGAFFEFKYSHSPTNDEGIVKGDRVVWLSSTRYNKIIAFVLKWDAQTYGCRVLIRFCEKGAGFTPVASMKGFIDPSEFKTPETLRDHLAWLAVKNEAYLK